MWRYQIKYMGLQGQHIISGTSHDLNIVVGWAEKIRKEKEYRMSTIVIQKQTADEKWRDWLTLGMCC